jgi:hypothetical protein
VKKCVEKALELHSTMRSCRAHYVLEFIPNDIFQESEAQIIQEQRVGDEVLCDGKHRVVFCRFPAFVKYGDDLGQNFDMRKILHQAEVVVEGLPIAVGVVLGRMSSTEEDTSALPAPGRGTTRRKPKHGDGSDNELQGENNTLAKKRSRFRSMRQLLSFRRWFRFSTTWFRQEQG